MDSVQTAALRRAADALNLASRAPSRKAPQFSFTRLLTALADGRLDGYEREVLQQYSPDLDPMRPTIPLHLLARRDLSVAASGGGYLVETDTLEPADVLRPWSVTARAGITMLPNRQGSVFIPKVSAPTTPEWLASEASPITGSQPTIGQIAMVPKFAAAMLTFSRQLAIQTDAEGFVVRELLRTVGTAVDIGVINGSGGAGEPTGLLNTPSIGTQAGGDFSHISACTMLETAATAAVEDERVTFLGTPTVRRLLSTRERAAGSGFIWDNDRIAGRVGYVSTTVPAGTLIAGDWRNITLALWGNIRVEVNPYDPSGFKGGTIQARLIVPCDVAVVHRGAFVVSAAIT